MRKARMRREVSSDRGAAAVEFALLLPLILVIVLGIIDFGGLLHAQVTLTQAAREGSRVAALLNAMSDPEYDSKVENRTKQSADPSPLLDGTLINVDQIKQCPNTTESPDAEIKVTYPFEYITPIGSLISAFGGEGFDGSITLSATGVMPCET